MEVVQFKRTGHDPEPVLNVFGIRTVHDGQTLWFRWCYLNERRAENVAGRLSIDSAGDLAANWTHDPQRCSLSSNEREAARRAK